MEKKDKEQKKLKQVVCPSCGYRMPIFYGEHAEAHGLRVACKARGCCIHFDVIIKDGVQIK